MRRDTLCRCAVLPALAVALTLGLIGAPRGSAIAQGVEIAPGAVLPASATVVLAATPRITPTRAGAVRLGATYRSLRAAGVLGKLGRAASLPARARARPRCVP